MPDLTPQAQSLADSLIPFYDPESHHSTATDIALGILSNTQSHMDALEAAEGVRKVRIHNDGTECKKMPCSRTHRTLYEVTPQPEHKHEWVTADIGVIRGSGVRIRTLVYCGDINCDEESHFDSPPITIGSPYTGDPE